MTLSSNQPYFLPYLAYWQLIHAADRFLIGDDFAFMKGSWIARNRILVRDAPLFIRMEVQDRSSFRLICDTMRAPLPVDTKLKTVEMAYHKAPFFQEGFALAEDVICYPERNLAAFLEHGIRAVCAYLGITTPIEHTSDVEGNRLFKREERIYDFCHRLGADTYINLIGGRALYHKEDFARQGIRLLFLQSELPPYRQFGGPFVEKLSILDAIMFNSREQLHEMLDKYSLIDG